MPARGFITTQPMTTIKYRLLICTKKILTAALLHVLHPLRASISITKTEWDVKKLCFILRTNFAAKRTSVRLRADKIKSVALILLSLSVLRLFLIPLKKAVKNFRFFQPLFFAKRMNFARFFNSKAL